MASSATLLLLIVAMFVVMTSGNEYEEEKESMFFLKKSKQIIGTEAGEVRVQRGPYEEEGEMGMRRGHLQIGFIRMKP